MTEAATVLSAAALLLIPGALLARALGMSRPLAWTAGPALTVLMAGVLTTLLGALSLPWNRFSAVVGTAIIIVACAALMRLVDRSREPGALSRPGVIDGIVLGSFLVVLAVRSAAAISSMGGLGRINNAFDAFFHTSAVAFIRDTGDASPLTGSAPLYSGSPQLYPLVFDALAALLPGDAITAANALMLVLVPIGFLTTAGLIRAALPRGLGGAQLLIPVLAGASTLLVFRSADALGMGLGLWPNLLSLVLIPAAVMVSADAISEVRDEHGVRRMIPVLRVLLVVTAVVMAHPSAFFAFVLGVLSLCTAVVLLAPARVHSRGIVVLAVVTGVLALAGFIAVNMALRWMDVTAQPEGGTVGLLLDTMADRPRLSVLPRELMLALPWWVLSAYGAVVAVRRRSTSGITAIVAVGALFAIIVLGSSLYPVLGDLTNAWYGAPERIMPALAVATTVLVAFAAHGVSTGSPERSTRLVAGLGAVVAIAALVVNVLPTRMPLMASIFDTDSSGRYLAYVTEEEQQFIEDAAAELPEDAVVLGDPWGGTSAFWSLGGVDVVYPTLAAPGILDTRRVGLHGHRMEELAKVCHSLERLGVTHLYTDTSDASGAVIARSRPTDPFVGVRQIDTGELAPVASDGPYSLYELDPPC